MAVVVTVASAAACSTVADTPSPTSVAPPPASASGAPTAGPEHASPEAPDGPIDSKAQVLFVGRFDTTDPAGPKAAWPGARILTRFDGTDISVTMSEFAEPWMEGAPSYWEISIDHGPWRAISMIADDTPHVFEIAKDLPKGPHEVELYKRSETQTGITQFLGFDLHGGRALPPPPRQARHIEVMGDSQTTGFGIEMIDAPETDCPGVDHAGKYQNFRKAWGAILGTTFDAEVHGIAYSGKGLIKNITPDDPDALVRYYPRANPNPAIQNSNPPMFDLTSWIPDVIVLAQGAIDFNQGHVDYGEFKTAYRTFVIDTLRARAPNAFIMMAVIGKGGRDAIPGIADEIIAERAKVGDTRLSSFVAKLYTWDEMLGCNGHGTPAFHQRVAGEMATMIRDRVGWR
ncbi:MAG: hypothetical protein KF819_17915 [Labilithrix sp.]|nr:hypothetical protein [Labilithrix sp.]